jgi:hypothetical protein
MIEAISVAGVVLSPANLQTGAVVLLVLLLRYYFSHSEKLSLPVAQLIPGKTPRESLSQSRAQVSSIISLNSAAEFANIVTPSIPIHLSCFH